MQKWQCRIAPSLGGGFEGTPGTCWDVLPYMNQEDPTVFFGLYGLPDFYALWRHKGRKAILWCGSDIQHFLNGYFLDEEGKMKIHPIQLSSWIDTYCENYVENELEQQALRTVGIRSKVVPSFLGNIEDYDIEYKWSDKPKVYTSVSGDNFELYGWDKIPDLAAANPDVEFHLYGNTEPFIFISRHDLKNIIVHKKIPQFLMNLQIKEMQGALRLTEFDGFSEIVAKSLLWGQYPISLIDYPNTLKPNEIHKLKDLKEPNIKGREELIQKLNKYPWNTNVI